jgi:hypothetical protein
MLIKPSRATRVRRKTLTRFEERWRAVEVFAVLIRRRAGAPRCRERDSVGGGAGRLGTFCDVGGCTFIRLYVSAIHVLFVPSDP